MTDTLPAEQHTAAIGVGGRYVLDIVIPVYNEERDVAACVRRLHQFLLDEVPYRARIIVADNASTDHTLSVARELAEELSDVDVIHLDAKGRGGALAAAWASSPADVVAYMDVDLSTDLSALMPLVAPLVSGHSDIAIGSRLAASSRVVRGIKRELVSRGYNLLLRGLLGARFSDAQCGFKALRADVARQLLPLVADTGWFFDTELLVLAEKAGLRIHEVPVDWIDDPDSRVDILATAIEDLKGCWRVGRALTTGALPLRDLQAALGREPLVPGVPRGMVGQMVRFGLIGIASTIAFALLYLSLHPALGAQAANLTALLLTALANTAANRAFTFGIRGRAGVARHHVHGLLIFAFGLAITSGSLYLLHRYDPTVGKGVELSVLVAANLVATLVRFVALRRVFGAPTR
ncbi:glycosyltransferase [Mycolicibacterium aichiense]|uniref:dolichyl-phosphate beta-glucosyltransferase n=1 Tax=Mycolicibacterium aichiense TaxID=1799 RepID=A0AAD1M995_9MYCO|nr:glycosyltransferase [Mycolicibacterium aichiense]MCV7021257.1 glycosyltransferase [Mycolicibacterium aichiense]BBX05837.1 putative glycosyltransferase [Mycolicibacterium aichiense]STZ24822.1 glycosyl transferase [Mycolicibacterium aichiense]